MTTRRPQAVFLCQTCRRCRQVRVLAVPALDLWCAHCQHVRRFKRVGPWPQDARRQSTREETS